MRTNDGSPMVARHDSCIFIIPSTNPTTCHYSLIILIKSIITCFPMGNKNLCGNIEGEQRAPLNAISPDYDPAQSTFKTVKRQYLKYPQKFPYVLTMMHQRGVKFVDKYFNCLEHEERVVGDEFYAFHNVMQITWRRAEELVKSKELRVTDRMRNESSHRVSGLHKILYWIMEQPKLVKQIFRFEELAPEGLVLMYLPYYGSHTHPIEIVIDNYLPMNGGSYVVPVPGNSTIGMLLLEKALAKLLGSYQQLRNKSGKEIFEIVVGIPVVIDSLGINDDQVSILSKFYNPLYRIASIQQELEPGPSQYVKLNVARSTNIAISIWQFGEGERPEQLLKHSPIILQLIRREKQGFSRVGYASRLYDNKTILRTAPEQQSLRSASQFLRLQQGQYYLHIYSQGQKSTLANIIVYSQHEVSLLFRKDNYEFSEIKRAMVLHTFIQRATRGRIEQFAQCKNIKSRFLWDGYRGILNLGAVGRINVKVEILPEYRRKIRFEESNEFQMQLEVIGSRVVSFIKLGNIDIGRFYRITPIA